MNVQEAREKAMQYCSRREYCRREMYDKVIAWGCNPAEAHGIIDFLTEQKYLDECRYTEAFVRDKLRFNKWGRMKIAYMLRAQKIDETLITKVLSGIDEAEYNKILTGELQKKHKTVSGNAFEVKGKLFRFASARGFEPEIVNKTIQEIAGS